VGTAQWEDTAPVSSQKGNTAIQLQGNPGTQWYAHITEGEEWCSFALSSATSDKEGTLIDGITVLYVYFTENTGEEARNARISIKIGNGETTTLTLTQDGQKKSPGTEPGTGTKPQSANAWAEIPAYKENPNYQYVTHLTELNGTAVRNYSICYDKSHKTALWVAYPLHKCYLGSLDRTDEWIYDPEIGNEYQIYVKKAYKEYPTYDRGHQIPSADRNSTRDMNAQTFYFTNQTPQIGQKLNQGIWQKLEEVIRKNYTCSDTLYVVTGAYFANSNTKATDNNGVKVDVPTHYFKVLLRTKSGMTGKWVNQCEASDLQTIGFWLENKAYSETKVTKAICKKVSEIENLTGFTFFPGIPAEVKNDFNAIDWNLN
jgi:endonuclease G